MDQNMQGSADTGTRDDTYDVISVLYHALQGVENCELFAEDASGDQELRQFFDRACDQQRQLAEEAKRLLHDRLMRETQGGSSGSAFSQFGSGGSAGGSGMSGGGSGMSSGGGASGSGQAETQGMGSSQDRQLGSAHAEGVDASTGNSSSQFGQSALGQGPRHTQMTTGGGGTSSF